MPSSNPRVSILIPTYNQVKFIAPCIASALDQTYDNLEAIVSDDASNDSTEQIVGQFLSDRRLRYERHSTNIGRLNNYRRLLYELASGDWVLMLDGDDCLLNSNYILHAVELALSAPDVVLVFGKVLEGQGISKSRVSTHMGLQPVMTGTEFFLRHPPFYDVTPPHMTCLFRRDVAIRTHCYRHDILSTDLESFYRLMIGHRIGFVDEIAGLWRQHDRNLSKRLSLEACSKNLIVFTGPRGYASSLGLSSESELQKWVRRGAARYVLGCLRQMFEARDLLEALRFAGYVLTFDVGIFGHAIARVARRIILRPAAQSSFD